jgi:hypothetical protein
MATLVQTFQASLPLGLYEKLQQLRRRYSAALKAAAVGNYTQREQQLRNLSRAVSHLLAEELRKAPAERGGLRMVDVLLAFDSLFPELRGFTEYETVQRARQRMNGDELGLPVSPRSTRTA